MRKFNNIEGLIKSNIKAIKHFDIIKVRNSAGRYLAEDIISSIDIPPSNNSAVDGYLFNYKNFNTNIQKKFISDDEINAGDKIKKTYKLKNAIKVSTGAVIPKFFNMVIMQEKINKIDQHIICKGVIPSRWLNIRKRGEDIRKNNKVFSSGHLLRPQDIGMLASLGLTKVKVVRKVKVGLLSNGNELVDPTKKKLSHHIYDSNRYSLFAFLKKNNLKVNDQGIVNDNYKKIKNKIVLLKEKCDVIFISGGASAGNKDFIIDIIKEIGVLKFWRVSVKPGRPFGFALLNKEIPILILPGNPVACYIIFFLFGKIILNLLQGAKGFKSRYFLVKSNFVMKKKLGREEFLRGKTFIKNNQVYVNKYKKQGAGILNSLIWSNGLIRLRSNVSLVKKDSNLEFYPFSDN